MKRTSLTRSQRRAINTIATHLVAHDIVAMLTSKGHEDAKDIIAHSMDAMPDMDKGIIAYFERCILETRQILAKDFEEMADLAGESK